MNIQKPYISIGLTGTLGSGKSTVSKIFLDKNCKVINTDLIAKNLYLKPENKKKLIEKFGEDCFLENGDLNIKFLSNQIFKNKKKLFWLENLIHPQVRNYIKEYLQELKSNEIVIFEVPLLFEAKLDKEKIFDFIIVVDAPKDLRKKRVMQNRNWTEEDFNERENNQMNSEKKKKKADFIIINDSTIENLKNQVNLIYEQILKRLSL